jgi:two-component system sensor histidine kinase PhoQ
MIKMPRSLSSRLLVTATVVLLVFLGLTGVVLDQAFRSGAEKGESQKLLVQIYALLAVAESSTSGLTLPEQLQEPGFNQLGSGLYGIISDGDGVELWRSPSALDLSLSPQQMAQLTRQILPGDQNFGLLRGVSDEDLYYFSYGILWEGEDQRTSRYVFSSLESTLAIEPEIAKFRQELWTWLGGAILVLVLLQAVIMNWGLSPLRRMADDIKSVESGRSEFMDGHYAEEIDGVARNLNLLLAHERKQRERYKTTLADLAHSLKTPLAILKGSSNSLESLASEVVQFVDKHMVVGESRVASGNAFAGAGSKVIVSSLGSSAVPVLERFQDINDTIESQVEHMDQIISYQLQRAVTHSPKLIRKSTSVKPLICKLVEAMRKVYADRQIDFFLLVEECSFFGDERDLMEIMGNLIDNACKYGNGTVRIRASSLDGGSRFMFSVEDDGPGISIANRGRVLERGIREDSRETGQGIGLAVVIDLVESYNGNFSLGKSSLGGTRVDISI